MRFLLTGGTIDPLKPGYLEELTRLGHTGTVVYPGEGMPDGRDYGALLLPGGADIEPARFGAAPLPNGSETFDIRRDELEFAVLEEFLRAGKPVIGICRGMQVINVAFGGTLWQDLPSQYGTSHSAPEGKPPLEHKVSFSGGRVELVNSYHHQAADKPGRGIVIAAKSCDGVAEALEHESLPIRAVQWHPEKGCGGFEWLLAII
jgi:putative glutamine amidotransferase